MLLLLLMSRKPGFSLRLEFIHASEVSYLGWIPAVVGSSRPYAQEELITTRIHGYTEPQMSSKARLLLTGTALERGRTHEMQTRAPILKTSALPVSQNWPLKGQSAVNSNQNWCRMLRTHAIKVDFCSSGCSRFQVRIPLRL